MFWRPGRKFGNLGILFLTFSLPTFRFWRNTQNRQLRRRKLWKKNSEVSEFSICHFSKFLLKCHTDLSFSSSRLMCFTCSFVFLSYFVWIWYCRALRSDYLTCKYIFKSPNIIKEQYVLYLKLIKVKKNSTSNWSSRLEVLTFFELIMAHLFLKKMWHIWNVIYGPP